MGYTSYEIASGSFYVRIGDRVQISLDDNHGVIISEMTGVVEFYTDSCEYPIRERFNKLVEKNDGDVDCGELYVTKVGIMVDSNSDQFAYPPKERRKELTDETIECLGKKYPNEKFFPRNYKE